MQLVSQNFSLDDVARLSDSSSQTSQAVRRLLAQYERSVPPVALSLPSPVVAQNLDNYTTTLIHLDIANDLLIPNSTRPLFCSSTHAPGRFHCMCHCMHHC